MKKYFILIVLIMAGLSGSAQSIPSEKEIAVEAPAIKVKVFPNPATNVVNILGLENTLKADITILDIYGNMVLARHWAVRRNALNIPISNLKSGAYIIHIRYGENHVQTRFYKK